MYKKVEGSCGWIDARDDFCAWRDGRVDGKTPDDAPTDPETISVFWVYANPGTGKTVLASHVVSYLQELRRECAYHYFHAGDTGSRSLGAFLKSIAYQMAVSSRTIREKLCQLAQDWGATSAGIDDSRIIWTKVFRNCILQVSLLPIPSCRVIGVVDTSLW